MSTINLEWGPRGVIPDDAPASWAARAIYHCSAGKLPTFDFLWDRQSFAGEDPEKALLLEWVNKKGLELMRQRCLEEEVDADSEESYQMSEGGYSLYFSPNGSCGYMYVAMWKEGHDE